MNNQCNQMNKQSLLNQTNNQCNQMNKQFLLNQTSKPKQPQFDISQTGNHLNVGKTFPNVVENGPHHVDAHAYGKIPLTKQTPAGLGGGLQYRHDFGHSASVNVDHVPSMGTTVDTQARARLFQSKDRTASLDLGAGARQHFGPRPSPTQGQIMFGFNKKF